MSHDRAMIDELWNSGAEAWFEGGQTSDLRLSGTKPMFT
jgi:general stress protein 26